MAVREKTRAQLFNLSHHSHAEQASAGGESSDEGKVSLVSLGMTYFSQDLRANRCKQTSKTLRNLESFPQRRWHKNLSDVTVWQSSCSSTCIFCQTRLSDVLFSPRLHHLPSLPPRVHLFVLSRYTKQCLLIPPSCFGCWWGCCQSPRERMHTHLHTINTHTQTHTYTHTSFSAFITVHIHLVCVCFCRNGWQCLCHNVPHLISS